MTADVGVVEVIVSADRMQLSVITRAPEGVPLSALHEQLEHVGIKLTPAVDEAIKPHLTAAGLFKATEEVALLRGRPPLDDTPAALQMAVGQKQAVTGDQPAPSKVDSVDFYSQNSFVVVKQDQVIGTIVPYSRGVDGMDVFGKTIIRKMAAAEKVSVGKNAKISEDGTKVIASMMGCVHTERLKVWVEPQLDIPKDVDFSTGHISFEGDVAIGRNVLDLFKVKVTGSLRVGGAIEAAEVEAGHDLIVQGGIVQKEKGHCKTGGAIHAKYVTNARLDAGGDVVVRKELANSRVVSGGKVIIEAGPLMGGTTVARAGVTCHSLGSAACVRTLVELGVDESLRKFPTQVAPEMEATYKRILTIRNDIAPMLNNQKTLNAQQKERITELMYDASEAETKLKADLAAWREKLHSVKMQLSGEIIVQDMLYAGVVLRFGEMETTIDKPAKGPMKITLRVVNHDRQIVLINSLTGSVRVLDSHHYHDDQLEQARKLLEEKFKL